MVVPTQNKVAYPGHLLKLAGCHTYWLDTQLATTVTWSVNPAAPSHLLDHGFRLVPVVSQTELTYIRPQWWQDLQNVSALVRKG